MLLASYFAAIPTEATLSTDCPCHEHSPVRTVQAAASLPCARISLQAHQQPDRRPVSHRSALSRNGARKARLSQGPGVCAGLSPPRQSRVGFVVDKVALGQVCFWARSQNCEKPLLASLCLSVCPSVRLPARTKQLVCHWTDFCVIGYFIIFRKSVEKIQVSLQSDKNNRYFTCIPIYISDQISLSSA
jgi:hypothetical protein